MNRHRSFKSITHIWANGGGTSHPLTTKKDCTLCKEDDLLNQEIKAAKKKRKELPGQLPLIQDEA